MLSLCQSKQIIKIFNMVTSTIKYYSTTLKVFLVERPLNTCIIEILFDF